MFSVLLVAVAAALPSAAVAAAAQHAAAAAPPPVREACAGWPLPNGFGATGAAMGAPPPPPGAPRGDWASVGNHRFEVRVSKLPSGGSAARALLPWNRHDANPNATGLVVLSSTTSLAVPKCARIAADGEQGDIVFEASDGPGLYHVYYMPFTTCEYNVCEYGASASYDAAKQPISCNDTTSGGWLPSGGIDDVPYARIEGLQSRTNFDAWTEMELAATRSQHAALLARAAPDGVLLVTEDRTRPVRMRHHLPGVWAERAHSGEDLGTFYGEAQAGEHYHFQVALYPTKSNLTIASASSTAGLAPLSPICMNIEGADYWGRPYEPSDAALNVAEGEVRSFFWSTSVPGTAKPGTQYPTTLNSLATRLHVRVELTGISP